MFTEPNEVLTVTEVMELLYIGKNTAYELLKSGELKGFRIGKTWRVPRANIDRYIEEKCKLNEQGG